MPMSWASAVGSAPPKKVEPPVKPAAPPPAAAPSAEAPPSATNGTPAPPVPVAATNGVPAPAPAPAATRPASAPTAPATLPARKPLYEPAPNEIMRVTLTKPQPDAKLGIRLAGEDRPRIISLNPEGLAAKAGCLSVNDVFLKVRRGSLPSRPRRARCRNAPPRPPRPPATRRP
jgi:hypothetical protein